MQQQQPTRMAAAAAAADPPSSSIGDASYPRIASLLPSATDIVSHLGLSSNLVGVTHECDVPAGCSEGMPLVLTGSLIDIAQDGQDAIDAKVKEAAERARGGALVCPITPATASAASDGELGGEDRSAASDAETAAVIRASSLYPINEDNLKAADPNVVLTQDLCGVCAPSMGEVRRALASAAAAATTDCDTADDKSNSRVVGRGVAVISLQPETLPDVADTFVTVADACGVRERGLAMRNEFTDNLELLRDTVRMAQMTEAAEEESNDDEKEKEEGTHNIRSNEPNCPRVLLLEWLDPPYDGGHWIPGMIENAGCAMATIDSKSSPSPSSWNGTKSKQVTWDDVYAADPDVVLVACCGFDLRRNVADAMAASDRLGTLRAVRDGRCYAADGNLYFARPGPTLLGGAAIVAQCAFDGVDDGGKRVKAAVQALDFAPKEGVGWAKVELAERASIIDNKESTSAKVTNDGGDKSSLMMTRPPDAIHDIEDIAIDGTDYSAVHKAACDAGQMDYVDPETGYHVFTELAHRKRGKCCGSGCRHCPFNHENVLPDEKAAKIKQPSFLYEGGETGLFSMSGGRLNSYGSVKILFFSGGKDSFLTTRAVVRQRLQDDDRPFGLVLLTTFDAASRIIAHQETPVDTVIRQATHLQIPLVGVPIHRGSSETYVDRVRRAMDLVSSKFGRDMPISLVFGDLHLGHIRHWRDDSLGKLDCGLEYPLWKVPYSSLMDDLEESEVACKVSASTRDGVNEGEVFSRELSDRVAGNGMDGFGEEGEFHTVAQVWGVDREKALGL